MLRPRFICGIRTARNATIIATTVAACLAGGALTAAAASAVPIIQPGGYAHGNFGPRGSWAIIRLHVDNARSVLITKVVVYGYGANQPYGSSAPMVRGMTAGPLTLKHTGGSSWAGRTTNPRLEMALTTSERDDVHVRACNTAGCSTRVITFITHP